MSENCNTDVAEPPIAPGTRLKTIALVGNPNTGKSSLFNALTGLNQHVGNFPGVTVDRKVGRLKLGGSLIGGSKEARLIDLPGTYGLYPKSEDELITCRILQNPGDPDHPDLVVVVADATNLKPSLLLATQVIDLGLPTVLVLNLADRVKADRLEIQDLLLARELGVPVLRTSARKGWGISSLKAQLAKQPQLPELTQFRIPEGLIVPVREIRESLGLMSDYAAYQLLLTDSEPGGQAGRARARAGINNPSALIANEIIVRYDRIGDLLKAAELRLNDRDARFTDRTDKVLLHPFWGYVVLVGLLLLIFQAIFTWARYPMEWIDGGLSALGGGLEKVLPGGLFRELLIHGVLAGFQGILIFIPQIALLFFFIAVLEETGYMGRAVFLMDRSMRRYGLSGKSVIPLFGGFACAVPSIMAVRSIPNKKERIITIMITPLMSCSARIPVYTVLIAVFIPSQIIAGFFDMRGLVMAGFYALGVVMALIVALVFKWVLKSPANPALFFTELPNYRMPRWKNVGINIVNKVKSFVIGAGQIILIFSVILWFLASFGPPAQIDALNAKYASLKAAPGTSPQAIATLDAAQASEKLSASYAGILGKTIEPVIKPLGYDWKIGIALISSFAAREVFVGTMNTLYSIQDASEDAAGYRRLSDRLQQEKDPATGRPVYTAAVALSLLAFYALAMQCMSTLAVVKRELASWRWAGILLAYQTGLAYLVAFIIYQVFR